MNSSYDPLYAGPRSGARGQIGARGAQSNNDPLHRPDGRNDSATSESNQNRAVRYEDEKRRIVESCFSKKEEDGVAAESYITHVRVTEDSAYPSTPPPPGSAASNKKSRVIIVAVKRTGRVRVHKARENPTGTFSIGKTWNLDELSGIQSFTNLVPRSHDEELQKEWANGVGFTVTLQKAYYWQAPTGKEKDFFIGSLIKIYRKYTAGNLPELYGFSSQETENLTGGPVSPNLQSQTQPSPQPFQPLAPPPPIPAVEERRSSSPHSSRSQGSDHITRARAQSRNEQGPPARDLHRPPPIEPLRSPMRNEDYQNGQDSRTMLSFDSAARPPPPEQPTYTAYTPAYLQATLPHPSSSAQSSQHALVPEKVNGRIMNGGPRPPQPPFSDYQQSGTASTHSGGSRPSTAVSERKSTEVTNSVLTSDSPPDRRRPFMGKSEAKSGAASETNSQFATPAATPSDIREERVPEFPLIDKPQIEIPALALHKTVDTVGRNSIEHPTAQTDNQSPALPEFEQLKSTQANPSVDETSSAFIAKKIDDEHRPGLGPMIKKKSTKDIANQFRKAALAATAFQPRQGGAGARLKALQDKDKVGNEPDGITSVVPAPLFRGMSSDTVKSSTPSTPTVESANETKAATAAVSEPPIQTYVLPTATMENDAQLTEINMPVPNVPKSELRSPSPEKPRSHSPERRKKQRQEAEVSKYCAVLGIDASIFETRGADFNDLLTEFGWEGKLGGNRRIEDFEADIKREIGRAQATGWLGHVEQQESKVQDLAKAFDRAIEECEELDGLFTLYSHELDTLTADIEYIEAQSQGLQVQTANQKLLQNELNSLLRTLTIPSSDLRHLQAGSLDSESGVQTAERSLALLYKALITIDPDLRQNKIRQIVGHNPERGGIGVYADTEIGQMRAVLEKKALYQNAAMGFVQRLNQYITAIFKDNGDGTLLNDRQRLWTYNAMMLFVREVNSFEWQTLISSYEINLKSTYQTQFRDYTMAQRKIVRKAGPEELEALFTTQEKEKPEESLTSTAARKLTVKRAKTVKAGALRHQLSDKSGGQLDPHEVFGGVLKHQSTIISEEQNFIVCFFHLNSQASADFAELISAKAPHQRRLPNLSAKQSYDPDRNMAKIVQGAIEGIYSFWLGDLQNLLDWAIGADALQGIGVLVALEQCLALYEETSQEYITRTIRTLHERLTGLFHKFVDEQIKAIEETKVKVKKRKGVISFMRTFPLFATVTEQMMPTWASSEVLEVRFILNDAYGRILKAMWESLSFIAKDDPASSGGILQSSIPSSGDPEDKEALNYHILLIENMNHYLEEVDTQKNVVLEEWADKSKQDLLSHLTQYTDSVIRRPLGKWLDFVESTETMIKNSEAGNTHGKQSHSRSTAKKVLSSHDGKEIKKGVETLKKRVEKHFGDAEDPSAASRALIARVLEECNARYAASHERMQTIIDRLYEGNLTIDWTKEEASVWFKK